MELKDFDNFLHDAEVKLKRLRALYEQWFQGIERTEPLVPRKDLERLFVLLSKDKPRNTAARFRLAQLQASYNLYQSHWQRIARQIEEGTFERDLRRVRRRADGSIHKRTAKEYEIDIDEAVDVDADDFGDDEIASVIRALESKPESIAAPAPAPRPALSAFSPFALKSHPPKPAEPTQEKKPVMATFAKPRATSPPAASPPAASTPDRGVLAPRPRLPLQPASPDLPGQKRPTPKAPLGTVARPQPAPAAPTPQRPAQPPPRPAAAASDEGTMRKLYEDFVAARRRNNESVEHLRYEAVAESVKKMVPKLREKHGDKKIEFEVVVQNGRVGFRPKIE